MGSTQQVCIIGAGLAGLSIGALLAKHGFKVRVIEKHPEPGGVARSVEAGGFRFDAGPTWYLMPEVYDRYFGFFGKRAADFYELVDLDPSYGIWFEGEGRATVSRDTTANEALFESFERGGGQRLRKYLANAKSKYDIAVGDFLYREYESLFDFADPRLMAGGLRLDILSTLDTFVGRYFRDHRAKKILEFNTVFLGSSPFTTPALYSLMAHADVTQGVFYPKGGISEVVKALVRLGTELGVEYAFGDECTNIVVGDGRVSGVETKSGFVRADIVVSACDYHHTESELLGAPYANYKERTWERKQLAPSTFLILLGLNKKVPGLAHHNFYFARDWKEHFDSIFKTPAWPENPSYYVGCPSKTDPTVAPCGGENLFILVPVASGLPDPDGLRGTYADKIVTHLESILGVRIADSIIVRKVFSQRDFANAYHLFKGTALGLAHTLWQTALFRPSHKSRRLSNLYYTGHYTQPGIGMPMAIIGSELVAKRIVREQTSS